MEFEDAVIDHGYGSATPQFVSSAENPANYNLPGNGGVNEWNQSFYQPWSATADVKLVNGQASLPLLISDDGVNSKGYESISWKVTNDVPIGFTQETYIFSEKNAATTVNIPISLNSSIKSTSILIVDKEIQPIIGDNANNSLNGGDGDDMIFALGGDDYVDGGKGNDRLYGETGQDTLIGNSGNDFLNGDVGNDNLTGNSGNDFLNGGVGNDNLIGGVGDDNYVIDSTGDSITEDANAGVDTVESSISYTLGNNNLENLTLEGSSDINGTGNALNNTITGNYGKSILSGGLGNDTYIVSTEDTIITEDANAGVDTVKSSRSYTLDNNVENLTLTSSGEGTGNALNNTITGSTDYSGDTLDGGLGSDTLVGQDGNDTYIIDSTEDTIIEGVNAGADTVESSITYTLGNNLEKLTLTGSSDINGTGNALNNTMTGNVGKNILSGGLGNDTYIIDNTKDTLIENANAGVDTVETSISYTLGKNLENLKLAYIYADNKDINGTGNALNNTITGNNGKNILSGGLGNDILDGNGNDTLIGGAGADTFEFYSSLLGIDTIKDFSRSQGDKVQVSSSGFDIEKTEYNRFSYNNSTGALFFDQTQFAALQAGLNFVPNLDIAIV